MPAQQDTWLTTRERGSVLGLRLAVFLATVGGRRLARFAMVFVAFYFVVFHGTVRRSSRDYFTRLEGQVPSFRRIYRHILRFAQVAVDRFFLVRRQFDLFQFTETGREHIEEIHRSGRGAILLGAHLGSFEAMRALSNKAQLPLNVVGYFKNARVFNQALEEIEPGCNVRLISIDPGNVSFIFKIKECIERGEMVAILADRVGLSGSTVHAKFLGKEAPFSSGVFALAATLRCPVYFTAGLYNAPNKYDLYCEPFADPVVLPRGNRKEAVEKYAQLYADRLEHHCRLAPDNWFNFFDFWPEGTANAGE